MLLFLSRCIEEVPKALFIKVGFKRLVSQGSLNFKYTVNYLNFCCCLNCKYFEVFCVDCRQCQYFEFLQVTFGIVTHYNTTKSFLNIVFFLFSLFGIETPYKRVMINTWVCQCIYQDFDSFASNEKSNLPQYANFFVCLFTKSQ